MHDGTAWLGIVAFVMVGTRTLGVPRALVLPPTPELNVRTYVRVGGVPGVWFLSLDASSRAFVTVGRALYGLRYRLARMTTCTDGDRVHYVSVRDGAAFAAHYAASGRAAAAEPGSREDFLFERYRLFADRRGLLVSARVAHEAVGLARGGRAHRREPHAAAGPHVRGRAARPLLGRGRRADLRAGAGCSSPARPSAR